MFNGVVTLRENENDTCIDTDTDNMQNISHCSDTERGNDADNMQNSLFMSPILLFTNTVWVRSPVSGWSIQVSILRG